MKKEVYQLLNNLEDRIGTAGRFDPTTYNREERKELIREHAVKYLAGLHSDDRCRAIDEAVLLKMGGNGWQSTQSRSGYEQQHGPELSGWPDDVRQEYFRNMIVSWMSRLEPDELKAVDEASKGHRG